MIFYHYLVRFSSFSPILFFMLISYTNTISCVFLRVPLKIHNQIKNRLRYHLASSGFGYLESSLIYLKWDTVIAQRFFQIAFKHPDFKIPPAIANSDGNFQEFLSVVFRPTDFPKFLYLLAGKISQRFR